MSERLTSDDIRTLEPVHEPEDEAASMRWTRWLVIFLRVMAGLSMLKGLYHWADVCGIGVSQTDLFENRSTGWQAATVFFAVLDLVAAVGLWLAAAWGAVIWLASATSMVALEVFFPQVFGGGVVMAIVEGALLGIYLWLALKSAQEQPA